MIIGGGYIGVELGQMFRRFGTEVTILERNDQLLAHGYEPQIGKTIAEVFKKEGIHLLAKASGWSVRQDGNQTVVRAVVSGKDRDLRAEKILIVTGRRPNSDKIDIDKAGVNVGKHGEVRVDQFLRTN